MNLTIKSLTPELLDDFLYFFDNIKFSENPHWSKCYCYSFHFTGTNEEWTKDRNRAAASDFIKKKKMKGYIAYDDEKPVGWCNVNKRENFQRLKKIYDFDTYSEEKTGSIVCFLISPEYRGKGIATKILQRIISDYKKAGYHNLEAYPGKGNLSNESQYKGPLAMYKKNGFRIIKELDKNSIVTLKL